MPFWCIRVKFCECNKGASTQLSVKFRYSKKVTKFWKKSTTHFWLSNVNSSNCVPFSQYLNCSWTINLKGYNINRSRHIPMIEKLIWTYVNPLTTNVQYNICLGILVSFLPVMLLLSWFFRARACLYRRGLRRWLLLNLLTPRWSWPRRRRQWEIWEIM